MIIKYEDPWLYYTVDNYFPHDIFKSMSESIQSFIKTKDDRIEYEKRRFLYQTKNVIN